MDLTPYTCRGFPGDFDRIMRDVPVAGIDRQQTHSMIRLCDQTEPILYGPDFSPRQIRYRHGSRPQLESIVSDFGGDISVAMNWTRDHVRHPNFAGVPLAPDRALSEEDLIASALGWCNEQCRVFIALCEVMQTSARLCFLFHANGRSDHTATELLDGDDWRVCDVTFGLFFSSSARECSRSRRQLDPFYVWPLHDYYLNQPNKPIDTARGGDFFAAVGICNYTIEGVEAIP